MKNSILQNLSATTSSTSSTPSTSLTPSTKIILVRHARTTYNEQGRYQGSSDESVLTAKGHQDAFTTGLALQRYNFDVIYTSPLTRVQQTTEAIVAALDANNNLLPVFIDSLLTEIGMSYWQGLYYQEVKEKFAEAYECWQNTPHLFSFNNVYPVLELFEKAKLFWQKVLSKHRGQTILIVAHGGTNQALISTAIALQPESYHSLQQSNCGISHLEFTPNNDGKLKYLNATEHLKETLPKLKAGKTGWRWLLLPETNAKTISDRSLLGELCSDNFIDLLLTETSLADSFTRALATNCKIPHFILQENHFFDWQQAIINRQKSSIYTERSNLTTGLIIASDRLITQILNKTFQINIFHFEDSLAVIHYPQSKNNPILQGILPLTNRLVKSIQ